MSNEETIRAEAFAKMSKAQRLAFIRQGATLNTTSSERTAAVAKLRKTAGGH